MRWSACIHQPPLHHPAAAGGAQGAAASGTGCCVLEQAPSHLWSRRPWQHTRRGTQPRARGAAARRPARGGCLGQPETAGGGGAPGLAVPSISSGRHPLRSPGKARRRQRRLACLGEVSIGCPAQRTLGGAERVHGLMHAPEAEAVPAHVGARPAGCSTAGGSELGTSLRMHTDRRKGTPQLLRPAARASRCALVEHVHAYAAVEDGRVSKGEDGAGFGHCGRLGSGPLDYK